MTCTHVKSGQQPLCHVSIDTSFGGILADMKKNALPPKGILFDMDGVLLITTQRSDQSWQLVCQQFAPRLALSEHRLEQVLHESRRAYRQEIQHDPAKQRRDRLEPFATRTETVERALKQVSRGDTALASEMVRVYERLRDEYRQLTPAALETLQKLRDWHIPLALISNGNASYQRNKLQQHGLEPFFDIILIEEEFGVAKPDPRIFLAALEHLHLLPQEAWIIGDNLAIDIAGAQRLGISAVWFDAAEHGLPEGHSTYPDHVIRALPELLNLLSDTHASL
jgi:putative hydrolase of the HAD superfamily